MARFDLAGSLLGFCRPYRCPPFFGRQLDGTASRGTELAFRFHWLCLRRFILGFVIRGPARLLCGGDSFSGGSAQRPFSWGSIIAGGLSCLRPTRTLLSQLYSNLRNRGDDSVAFCLITDQRSL